MKTKEPLTVPDYTHPVAAEITGSEQAPALVYSYPGGNTLTITGDYDGLMDDYKLNEQRASEAAKPARTNKVASMAVKAAVEPPKPQNQYVDYSELPSAQVARMKLRSRVYDALHRTSMTDRLIDRINEDRDLAFARSLGLVGVTHCQKHEKAVAKLRGLTV